MEQLIQQKKEEKQKTSGRIALGEVTALEVAAAPSDAAKELKKLRLPRTRKYVSAIKAVDTLSENDKQIIEAVQALPVNNRLLGILAPCMIPGCIVHAIDREGTILSHYKEVLEIPGDLQAGYEVFLQHEGCTSVEVYTQTFCVVYGDGSIKFIEREGV